MRVVFAPHAYSPSIGGAERYAQGLAEGLAELGHEVHVVVPDIDDPEAFYELGHAPVGVPRETMGGVNVHRLPFATFRYRYLGRMGEGKALGSARKVYARNLESFLDATAPDVVVALPHLFPNVEELVRQRSSANWKLVYVPMLHEADPNWSVDRVAGAVQSADLILALTQHEKDRLTTAYGARPVSVVVVPPGVDSFRAGEKGQASRSILFVGRRAASKRLDLLFEAMTEVWVRHPESRLVLAGSPPHAGPDPADSLSERSRVEIVDSPDETTKAQLIEQSAVMVNPSEIESFGMTTIEAWAHGTPVVVIDTPVNRSIVRDGRDGLLVPPEPGAIADAVNRLLQYPELAHEMGIEGLRRVAVDFEWRNLARTLERAIVEMF